MLSASACGSHLHRQGDALLSEAAQAEVESIEFDQGFAAREAQEGELLAEELDAALAQVDADRDGALLVVIDDVMGSGRSTWARDLDARLASLTGVGADADMAGFGERFGAAADDLAAFEDALRRLERERDTYLAQAVALDLPARAAGRPMCPGADDPARAPGLDDAWRGFEAACDEALAMRAAIAERTPGGSIRERTTSLVRLHELLGARAEQVRALWAEYEAERARCRSARPADGDDNRDAVAAAVASCLRPSLDDNLLALGRLELSAAEAEVLQPFDLSSLGAGAGSVAHARLIDEQLAAVERLLAYEAAGRMTSDAAAGDVSEAVEVGLALAVAQTVARIHVDAKKGRFSLPRSELSLVRELLAVDRDGAREIGTLARERLDLLDLGLEALLRERVELLAAQSFLLEPSCAQLSIAEALLPADGAGESEQLCASYLRGSLIQYANSWSVGVARQREAEVRADALHEHELRVRSSMSLAVRGLWMAAAIAELHRYNATGLRPETLAMLLTNVAGFAVVAAGVFR